MRAVQPTHSHDMQLPSTTVYRYRRMKIRSIYTPFFLLRTHADIIFSVVKGTFLFRSHDFDQLSGVTYTEWIKAWTLG